MKKIKRIHIYGISFAILSLSTLALFVVGVTLFYHYGHEGNVDVACLYFCLAYIVSPFYAYIGYEILDYYWEIGKKEK